MIREITKSLAYKGFLIEFTRYVVKFDNRWHGYLFCLSHR